MRVELQQSRGGSAVWSALCTSGGARLCTEAETGQTGQSGSVKPKTQREQQTKVYISIHSQDDETSLSLFIFRKMLMMD